MAKIYSRLRTSLSEISQKMIYQKMKIFHKIENI